MYVCNYPFNVSEISLLSKQLSSILSQQSLYMYVLGYQL